MRGQLLRRAPDSLDGLPGAAARRSNAALHPVLAPIPDRPADPAPTAIAVAASSGGYRQKSNWPMLVVVIALHAAVGAILMTTHAVFVKKAPPPAMAVFDIAPAPPPPPSEPLPPPPEPAPSSRPEVSAPVAMVKLPTAAPLTLPASPAPIASAPVVPAAPARPAPPAPVTPPDFEADQLNNPGPRYPYLSRRAKEQGTVLLRVLVNADGRPDELRVQTSSGFERLDKAALAAVRRWKFLPARQAGRPVAAWVLVPITFALS